MSSASASPRAASRSAFVRRLVVAALLLLPLTTACDSGAVSGDPPPPATPEVARVVVTPAAATLQGDSTLSLTAAVLGPNDEVMDRAVTWSTSSQEAASVSPTGEVRAGRILGGSDASVTITATAGNRSGTATITVERVPAATVLLNEDELSMMRGALRPLQATVLSAAGETLTERTVSWTSSDDDVVRVTPSGGLTAAAEGTAQITATADGAHAVATVRVLDSRTYAVPVALEDITWPWSYLQPSLPDADTPSDPCALRLETLAVPKEFMGRHALPELSGAPLRADIRRGIGAKDVWQRGNPSFADGCSGDVRAEFLRTLDRVATLGGDYITLIPWTFIEIQGGEWSIVNPGELESSIVDDEDLRWAVQQARARGIGVHWINQIQGAFEGDHFFVPDGTRENVATFFDAYAPYMLERAEFLEDIGAAGMQVSCTCWTWLAREDLADLYEAALAALLPGIRSRFSGEIRMAAHPAVLGNAAIRNNVDVLEISFAFGVHGLDADDLTLSLATSRYTTALLGEVGLYAAANKPFLVDLHAVSRANFLTTDYLEETFCVAEFGTIWGSPSACIQRQQETDFSLQAMLYAAKLDVIRQHASSVGIHAVEARDYWMVDQLVPSTTFPNLAVSPRNKPAEGVLYYFFRR